MPFCTVTLRSVYFYDKYFFILIIIHAIIRIIQLFSVMLSVAWYVLLRKVYAVNSYCSQSKQLIMFYCVMTYKTVNIISTNRMAMFRPFGQHKIQNQNFEFHSD